MGAQGCARERADGRRSDDLAAGNPGVDDISPSK